MPLADPAFWTDYLRRTLASYDVGLLRQVAGNLCRPRNQWPAEELIERCLQTVDNPAVVDRRLAEQDAAARALLALIAHSRQPRWQVGHLVELSVALGQADGLEPVRNLLQAGLLFPDLRPSLAENGRKKPAVRIKSVEQWFSGDTAPAVFAHPAISERALGADLGLPPCPGVVTLQPSSITIHEADGLEWPLRLAVLWQRIKAGPLRRTQQRDLFKRDLDRLRGDTLLNSPAADSLGEVADPALFTVALALAEGVLRDEEGELRVAAAFPPAWDAGIWPALASLWAALPQVDGWNPATGWQAEATPANPYPSAILLALLLLTRLPENGWASPDAIEEWIARHHPFWMQGRASAGRTAGKSSATASSIGVAAFLRGIAFPLRLLQATKTKDESWVVRLSPVGRWILGIGEAPAAPAGFSQTLLVQPNLEILAYRQGLSPQLLVRLTRLAAWKSLGAACTLQLEPETVYRALEAGETFETMLQTLERHGQKTTPAAVVEALRTWANKRERLSVYPAAALLEFATPSDLQEALSRGIKAIRLTDRLAVVANEDEIDYRHFRLAGTRDYTAPPERCVDVDADGVTLSVDVIKSDLLLETELQEFAEAVPRPSANGRRVYRLTPATLAAGRSGGLDLAALETWFSRRCGEPLSPAARLLFTAAATAPLHLERHLVLRVADTDVADGLCQWPTTRALIRSRLGPTALSVQDTDLPRLLAELQQLGITAHADGQPSP